MIKIGVQFPILEIGNDPGAIREFVQAADDMGYTHLVTLEHILQVDEKSHPGYEPMKTPLPLYLLKFPIHEPFVLFGFIAAVTRNIELFTQILILPQRQTALVAKQAAEIDILSKGRLKLGVAVGHTDLEYEGLGIDFKTRAARIEEQIEVLRLLWTHEKVDFKGRFHTFNGVGINPLPIQRPIPIWMGGYSDPVMRRGVRLADGMVMPPKPQDVLRLLKEAGRDPSTFGMTATLSIGKGETADMLARAKAQEASGITHTAVGTQGAGFTKVEQHIAALGRFRDAYGAF